MDFCVSEALALALLNEKARQKQVAEHQAASERFKNFEGGEQTGSKWKPTGGVS